MTTPIRVVHYLNQFFGGLGGEDQAGAPLQVRPEPVGPGKALQQALGDRGKVAATLIAGDNYVNEQPDRAREELGAALVSLGPVDVLVAGPAFGAGRYGLACGLVGQVTRERWGVPAVAAMAPDNPAVEQFRRSVYLVPAGPSAASMGPAVAALARLALKLGAGEPLGSATAEGYLPTGERRNVFREAASAERGIAMLLRKLRGEPFQTELPVSTYEPVPAAPAIADLTKITVAIATEVGVVPKGNPDRMEWARATKWASYPIGGLNDLTGETHESIHGGYDNTWANQDPDRSLGVDTLRELEREGIIGRLLDRYYVTMGNGTPVEWMARYGREMAAELKAAGVGAVISPAT